MEVDIYMPKSAKPKQVQRYPRLLEGKQAGALAKLMWRKPDFSACITENNRSIEFRYRVTIPMELKAWDPGVWELFFGARIDNWERTLNAAYRDTKSGAKQIHQVISNHLRTVFTKAMFMYLEDLREPPTGLVKNVSQHEHWQQITKDQLDAFWKLAKVKRSQPDPWLALQIDKRFRKLRPIIKGLQIRLDQEKTYSYDLMERAVRAPLSAITLMKALRTFLQTR
jgi:hypothetical protein